MINRELSEPKVSRSFTTVALLAIELSLAILIGLGFALIGLNGAAWILGGIAAGAFVIFAYRQLSDESISPNRNARKIGQLLIGLTIGLSLQQSSLSVVTSQLLTFLGLPLFLMIAGAAIGVIYARLERTDLLTALLATTPGNVGVMASIAADYSKNAATVTIVQLLRFTTVIFLMPLIANVTLQTQNESIPALIHRLSEMTGHNLLLTSLMIVITLIVVYLGGKLKLPMAAFLGAIGVGLAFDLLPLLFPTASLDLQLPIAVTLIGQILLGVTIGEYWGVNSTLQLSTLTRAVVPVSLMLIAGLLAAALVQALTHWEWLTCLLVTAPGGSPEMISIALTLQQDPEIITTGHVIRLLTINLSLPILIAAANSVERRLNAKERE